MKKAHGIAAGLICAGCLVSASYSPFSSGGASSVCCFFSAAPRMSPSEAPELVEPYWATASFSSAISSALIDSAILRRLLVDVGDAGVDLLARGEAVGPLLGALARQLGAADEGGQVGIGDLHLDAGFHHLRHLAGDDGALLQRRRRLRRSDRRRPA